MDKYSADSADVHLDEPMEECTSFLAAELEALESIYINEITIKDELKSTVVSIDLHPATADKLDEQYVRMTLQFIVTEGYPDEIPEIKIRNPRGLSEEKLNCISQDLLAIAESKRGSSMLFEMIDAAKEYLTMGNRPSGECAICLYGFSDTDIFSRTPCYHYFHSHCLARYTKHFFEASEDLETEPVIKIYGDLKLLCPMCRIPIKFETYEEDYPPPEASDESDFVLTEEISEIQKRMADLFKKQVEKGGIIDVEAEKNKYLLEISNVPSRVSTEEKSDQKLAAESDSVVENKTESVDLVESPSKDSKEHDRDQSQQPEYKSRNRNFGRPNENRGNYRYDRRYNKQSYNTSRGNYNRNRYEKHSRYDKHNDTSNPQNNEDSNEMFENVENAATSSDLTKSEDSTCSKSEYHNVLENTEKPPSDQRHRQNYDSSPRYNRGFRRGNYGNNSYGRGRRSSNSNFQDRNNSPKYSSVGNEDRYSSRREYDQRDTRTSDYDSRKSNYRSGNFKGDNDFYPGDRYSDRNSYRGGKVGYGRRENYSHDSSNYSRRGRYGDSGKEQHYSDRDRSFRERRMPRDDRYRGNNAYDGARQRGSRNYTGNRYEKPVNETYSQYPKDENRESADVSSRSQSSDSNALSVENETLDNLVASGNHKNSSEIKNKTMVEKDIAGSEKKVSDIKSGKISGDENGLNISPSVFKEIPQGSTQISVNPPPGFANPLKKVVYGLQGANPPPGFHRS